MRIAATLLALAGCDYAFRLDRLPPPADATPPDLPSPDVAPDAPPECIVEDPFDGTTLSANWALFASPGFSVTQNDRLDIAIAPGSLGEGGIRYGQAFDLSGASVEVEVPVRVLSDPNVENYIRLRVGTDNTNGYVIRYGGDQMTFSTRIANVYEPHVVRPVEARDRFWRIENGPTPTQVRFSTRATAQDSWTIETTQPAAIAFDNIQVLLVAGEYFGGIASATSAAYDNFRVCGGSVR